MKKLLSLLLVFSMVICIAPVFNLAVFADDVIEISSADQFYAIENNLGGSYKLTADITVSRGIGYGDDSRHFTGTFDGDGHTVTLALEDPNSTRMGLFCTVSDNCTVKNLKVNGTLSTQGNSAANCTGTIIGLVAGKDNTVTLENIITDVDITDNAPDKNGQGGLIGDVGYDGTDTNPTVKIINCTNNGDITGVVPAGLVGAIRTKATVEITGCTNNGNITCVSQYNDYRGAAGFIGKAQNNETVIRLKNSTNNGTITSNYIAANAFVSHNNVYAHNYSVDNCTNNGTVISGGYVLPASFDTAQDSGTWSWGGFSYNASTKLLSGSPSFHAYPNVEGVKAYANGVEVSDKITIERTGEDWERKANITVDFTGVDITCGFRSVTIVWGDGRYSTFGIPVNSKQLSNAPMYGQFTGSGGCGFLDSNITFSSGWTGAGELNDIKVYVNGAQAFWNKGYEGYQHCGLNGANNIDKSWIHMGIVGADLNAGDNNTILFTDGIDIYKQTFSSSTNALGTSYAKVTSDASAHKTVAEIIFNKDPGFAIGTTFEGRVHDNHDAKGTFKVTDYNKQTGMYTIVGEGFVPTHTLLELKVTSEGQYKDYWVCATINAKNNAPKAGADVIAGSTVVPVIQGTSNQPNGDSFGVVENLFDGNPQTKMEGGWPGTVTINIEAERSTKLSYIVFYTHDDGDWPNRAPRHIKLYGSDDNSSWTPIMEIQDTNIQNVNYTAYAVDVSADTAYRHFKLEVLSAKGGYFQIADILLLEGNKIADNLAAGEPFNSADGTEYQSLAPEGNDDYELYYQTRPGADGTTDYRIIAVVSKEYLEGEYTRINLTGTFTSSQDSKSFSADLTKAYALIEANAANGAKTVYATNDEYAIVGIVITGVESGYTLDVYSVDIGFSGNDGFIPV